MANSKKKRPANTPAGKVPKSISAEELTAGKATAGVDKPGSKRSRRLLSDDQPSEGPAWTRIILAPEAKEPQLPKVVGPAMPFDLDELDDDLDPETLAQLHSENLTVHPHPDPQAVELDSEGYVVGYVIAPPGKSHIVHPGPTKHVKVPRKLLEGRQVDTPMPSGEEHKRSLLKLPRSKAKVVELPWDLFQELFKKRRNDRRDSSAKREKDARKGRKGKGGKGGKEQGGDNQRLPGPALMDQVISELIAVAGLQEADHNGNIVIAIQNCEFLTKEKALFYLPSWSRIFKNAHVIIMVEVDPEGLAVVADAIGYAHYCCKPNSRGQAVGLMVHPRLAATGSSKIFDKVASVKGIPDLRPVLYQMLADVVSDFKTAAAAAHLKAMRPNEQKSSPVRKLQAEEVGKAIEEQGGEPAIFGGDLNCPLDRTHDLDALFESGGVLVEPDDTTATHQMGSRLDGFVLFNFKHTVSGYNVVQWFSDSRIGRALTDHAFVLISIDNTAGPTALDEASDADETGGTDASGTDKVDATNDTKGDTKNTGIAKLVS